LPLDLRKGGDSKKPEHKDTLFAAANPDVDENGLVESIAFLQTVGEDFTIAQKRRRNKTLFARPIYEGTAAWLSLIDDYCILLLGDNLEQFRNIGELETLGVASAALFGEKVPLTKLIGLLMIAIPKALGFHLFISRKTHIIKWLQHVYASRTPPTLLNPLGASLTKCV
jgi:hypothetical protein